MDTAISPAEVGPAQLASLGFADTQAPPVPRSAQPDDWAARHPRLVLAVVVVLVWTALAVGLGGRWTLERGAADLTGLHRWLNDVRDAVGLARSGGAAWLVVVDAIRTAVDTAVVALAQLIAQPSPGRPVPQVGWLGVVAVAGWVAALVGTWRTALGTVTGLGVIGALGLWTPAMDTLALTVTAVVLGLALGVPLGIAAGLSERATRLLTPVLDVAQTMPAVVYLAPLTLFFLIGPASATIVTLVYALPPVVRLTAHGLRGADPTAGEAAASVGATGGQRLRWVLLPLARRSIALGANQTIMAALSMVTIAALIDAPGLGKNVLRALESLDVGRAFTAGLAIVILAVVLDRVTTAAVDSTQRARHRGRLGRRLRAGGLAVGAVAAFAAVLLSRTYLWAAQFPADLGIGLRLGPAVERAAADLSAWATGASAATTAVKDAVSAGLLDPLERLLAGSPWFVVVAALVSLAGLLAGRRAALVAAGTLTAVLGTGLWSDAMRTLAATLVGTAVVLAVGVVVGVWAGRSPLVHRLLRPVLDAAQTMPAFVYLVPFVALFGVGRFTAIVAAVVFAAPVAIRIVADGVRAVPAATVEAATSAGCTTWQVVTAVQLPMSARALTLALNQGLIYVLSMVVVGALVGAGALGYDVIAGFSQSELYGKGLAAGAALVLLGIGLDRVSRAAADRGRRPAPHTAQR